MDACDGGRPPGPGGPLSPAFRVARLVLPPGGERAYRTAEWRDALVVVAGGEVEIECRDGRHRRFGRGEVLWLSGLPLRALRNPGSRPAVLAAVSRRRP